MIRPAWASNPDSPITAARQRVQRRYQQRHRGRHRGWSKMITFKFKMADGRHIGKCCKCSNSPTNESIWTKLGWSHLIMSQTCPPWCGCHGNSSCLGTAHWTFSCYKRLEAERVNRFWWNLVRSSANQELNDNQVSEGPNINIFKIQDGGRPPSSKMLEMP